MKTFRHAHVLSAITVLTGLLLSFLPTVAQEEVTLEMVTANSDEYYDTQVTLDGQIVVFLSSQIFVLGEETAIDDDRVLVVNNSGEDLPPLLIAGLNARVTGIVLPSYSEILEAAEEGEVDLTLDETLEEQPEEQEQGEDTPLFSEEELNVMGELMETDDFTEIVYAGWLPEEYDVYTIIVLEDVELLLSDPTEQE